MSIILRKTPDGIPSKIIEHRILLVRGRKVMLDADLAGLYSVSTKALNQAVKRNMDRFPEDFMFQLTNKELEILRSQTVTSRWGGLRYAPYAFTEQGIAMLSSVLRSPRAIAVNILIVRVFVKLRELMASHEELARRVDELERKYGEQDGTINEIFGAIKKLLSPPREEKNERPMGFLPK